MNIGEQSIYTQYQTRFITLQPSTLKHEPIRLNANFTLTIFHQSMQFLASNLIRDAINTYK